MLKRNIWLGRLITEVVRQYRAVQQHTQQPSYRLIDITANKQGGHLLIIQVAGKTATFKATPEEILANNNLVNQFSGIDIRTIAYYACQTSNQPKSKIVSKRFSEKLNKIIFCIKNTERNLITEVTAAEISLNKKIITELSAEDAHIIGYVTSQETHHCEKEAIQQAREDAEANTDGNRFR